MDFNNFTIATHPKIDSHWSGKDYLGALRVRFSMGRKSYTVNPGLYKLGSPGRNSEVLVTSNYKLSFDILRRNLKGLDVWVLVLETYGVNVWCAAGKGTFGTDELIKQINQSQLNMYVSNSRIIVPQLGAPGISAHKVKKETGFKVEFGPVRAEDIKEYLALGLKKSKEMRTVQFNFIDRLILTPVEIVNSLRYLLYALIVVFLISGIGTEGFSFSTVWDDGLRANVYLLSAYMAGAFIVPLTLPWVPFRYFGGKGLVIGFLVFALVLFLDSTPRSVSDTLGLLFLSVAVSSFLSMNFTGASTFTSLSGVRKEMKIFVPLQIVFILAGLILVVVSKFV